LLLYFFSECFTYIILSVIARSPDKIGTTFLRAESLRRASAAIPIFFTEIVSDTLVFLPKVPNDTVRHNCMLVLENIVE
jgi:hypothetical protein